MSNVGKIIWARGRKEKGIVVKESFRWCAACGRNHDCYIVKWDDGTKTKPCTAGIKTVGDELEIE
jgi:hypothetical protein